MYIDFHTHAFDEKIAQRAIEKLEATAQMTAFTRGTVGELLEIMQADGVDKSVILPIATKPTQQTVVNNWAKKVQDESDGKLFCFGSVHPDADDVLEEVARIKSLGLYGVKFHPDYQDFFVDEEKMFPIYEKCAELDLAVLFHAGFDPLSPDVIHCVPKASRAVFDRVPNLTLILAHLGGMNLWDEVEEYLCGVKGELYFDVGVIAGACPDEQLLRIIKNHGADRILFASDCPWHRPSMEMEMLKRIGLTEAEREQIFYKNAQRLLKL